MPELICPVCKETLARSDGAYKCPRGHSYDIARQGYVNLLMSNASSAKRHGDDKLMVSARTDFLDKGYYDPLRDAICESAVKYCAGETRLLDVGCGEGRYTAAVKDALIRAGGSCSACGIDISRSALIAASKRDPDLTLAVASVNALPVGNSSCDLLLNVFAPECYEEFGRVLKSGGILIRAVPLEDHLMGLKKAIYESAYLNQTPRCSPDGFTLLDRVEIRSDLELDEPEEIKNLFMMTPYYYKTGREGQKKLFEMKELNTEISFCVFVLKKN